MKNGDKEKIRHGHSMYVPYGFSQYAKILSDHDITSVGIDMRGFGRSEGLRAYPGSFEDIISDNLAFLRAVYENDPMLKSVPLFLMGHSIGATVCAYMAIQNPRLMKGMILFAPAYRSWDKISWYGKMLPKMESLLYPFRKMGVMRIARERGRPVDDVIESLKRDPLIYKGNLRSHFFRHHNLNRLKTLVAAISGYKTLFFEGHKIAVPYVLYHGDADRTVEISFFPSDFILLSERPINPTGFAEGIQQTSCSNRVCRQNPDCYPRFFVAAIDRLSDQNFRRRS